MTLGAEPKKIVVLGVLLAGVAIALYVNVFSGDSSAPAPVAAPPVTAMGAAAPVQRAPLTASARVQSKQRRSVNHGAVEFKVRLGPENPEDRVDPATVDPTLRLDLLAKVQNVEPEEAVRNLFQYGKAVVVAPPAAKVALPTNVPRIPVGQQPKPPGAPGAAGPVVPGQPQAPKMTFKYYGYRISRASGRKQAFLLDGDEIIVAGEDEAMKGARYKILKIGVSFITIEDTQFKSSQTLQLTEETPS